MNCISTAETGSTLLIGLFLEDLKHTIGDGYTSKYRLVMPLQLRNKNAKLHSKINAHWYDTLESEASAVNSSLLTIFIFPRWQQRKDIYNLF